MIKRDTKQTGTDSEVDFIDKLGTFGENPKDPIPLLEGYIRSCELRQEWGAIDKRVVLAAARNRLKYLQKGKRK